MKKRGQAAMEFLMTYGWAILAAIIVIGVIAFYILPNLGSGGSSNFQQPFYVAPEDVRLSQASGLEIKITYNGNGVATLTNLSVTSSGKTCEYTTSTDITSGSKYTFAAIPCVDALVTGENFKGKATITYSVGGGYTQIGTGTVSGVVQ